ncbi:MAG: response regulator [Kofleriaceae bacterium]|nr:response regulator [Kofleriaceae bacterium]
MFERLPFRYRIAQLIVLAAFGLVAVTAVTLILGRRNQRELESIETRYVPLVEIDRDLRLSYTQMTRALGEAASSADEAGLDEADAQYDRLVQGLDDGALPIAHNGGDAALLQVELAAYYRIARSVSIAIAEAKHSSAELAPAVEAMQHLQIRFAAHLEAATAPDRNRLAAAFAAARASQREALAIDIVLAVGVLAIMVLVSLRIIRRVTRALLEVSEGVERLASGEFGQEIAVDTRDELGDLAREANRTAVRLREYRDQLESRNTELARASRYKSEFLANMSHELRTPLNSIMILSKVLADNDGKNLTAKQVEFATLINRSGEELLALINEVLDLSKIEAGKQTIVTAPVRVGELGDYLRRMFEPQASHRKLAYAVELDQALPSVIHTDRARLGQILKNLLSNAFKFTERGAVTVRMFRPTSDDLARLGLAIADPIAITVTDTGIGIAADKLAAIFEAFTQAESGTSRKYGGTGLGLTIGKQLAMLLGGDLVVESALGGGSTFWIVLPIGTGDTDSVEMLAEPVAPEPRAITPASAPTADLEGTVVLLVDDDMRNVYSLSSALRERKLAVVTATEGQEALDALAANSEIDAVLLDVMMPGMDGYETVRRIRENAQHRTLPVIALTARAVSEERERCLAAGATDCITKPVDVDKLVEVLGTLVTRQEADRAAPGS